MAQALTKNNLDALQALWTLSGFNGQIDGGELSRLIGQAPDPETARRVITRRMRVESSALEKKWQKVISQTWLDGHPNAYPALDLPFSSGEVAGVPALRDFYAFLHAIEQKPARLLDEGSEKFIHPDELDRFLKGIPSLQSKHKHTLGIEHEWACVPLRRLRHLAQTLRLVRPYKGQLVLVQSRWQRFNALPLPQQFYVLWHADTHHIKWSEYAPGWEPYLETAQQHLPLLWEISHDVTAGQSEDAREVMELVMDSFANAWDEEGAAQDTTFIDMYKQSTLPAIMHRLIVDDLFVRYGLVEPMSVVNVFLSRHGQTATGGHTVLEWTDIGQTLLRIEHDQDLPCGLDIF